MANIDTPVGMWPSLGTGGSTTPRVRKYQVAAGVTTNIGQGSPVILHNNGVHPLVLAGSTAIIGVAQNHWVSGTSESYDIFVFDDPKQIFTIQAANATFSATAIGNNYSFVAASLAMNTTTLRSKGELDGDTGNHFFGSTSTAGNRPLRLVAISTQIEKNEAGSSWVGCEVQFNSPSHFWAKETAIGNVLV